MCATVVDHALVIDAAGPPWKLLMLYLLHQKILFAQDAIASDFN
jgi:hypothetical protein